MLFNMIDVNKLIHDEMVKHGIKATSDLAKRLHLTRQAFYNRQRRDAWSVRELEEIANILSCELHIEFIPIYSKDNENL